jgi:hypothetical protein
LQEKYNQQSMNHLWFSILKSANTEKVNFLLKLSIDIVTDIHCATPSARSWPARYLGQEYARQVCDALSSDWNCQLNPFQPTGSQMHYVNPDIYTEMLACIADEIKMKILKEVEESDCIGIQIDGASDRQQIGVKFVTARLVKSKEIRTRFLLATEVTESGAAGLLQAFTWALQSPGDVSSRTLQFKYDLNDSDLGLVLHLLLLHQITVNLSLARFFQ